MKFFVCVTAMLFYAIFGFASVENHCSSNVVGYKVLKHTVFPFFVDKKMVCFFAFYTTNPDPMIGSRGNGNLGDAVWYGYYQKDQINKVYELQKPSDSLWSNVCSVDAVSFKGKNNPQIIIIGSCNKNAIHYTIPFVFNRRGQEYVLDEEVYRTLYSFLSLTVADVRAYMKSPESYLKVLKKQKSLESE